MTDQALVDRINKLAAEGFQLSPVADLAIKVGILWADANGEAPTDKSFDELYDEALDEIVSEVEPQGARPKLVGPTVQTQLFDASGGQL